MLIHRRRKCVCPPEYTGGHGPEASHALATLREFVELLEAVERTLSNYSPQLYQQNLESILHDLSPGRNGGLAAAWALCTSGTYRRARAAILSARNGEAPSRVLSRK